MSKPRFVSLITFPQWSIERSFESAAEKGDIRIQQILLKNFQIETTFIKNILQRAAMFNRKEVINELFYFLIGRDEKSVRISPEKGLEYSHLDIHDIQSINEFVLITFDTALEYGQVEVIKTLLSLFPNVIDNARLGKALEKAAFFGNRELIRALRPFLFRISNDSIVVAVNNALRQHQEAIFPLLPISKIERKNLFDIAVDAVLYEDDQFLHQLSLDKLSNIELLRLYNIGSQKSASLFRSILLKRVGISLAYLLPSAITAYRLAYPV